MVGARRLQAMVLLCCALAACACEPNEAEAAAGPEVAVPRPVAEQAEERARTVAAAQAIALLESVQLPPGTSRLTAEPADDGGALPLALASEEVSPTAAVAAGWATVEEPAATVFAYLQRHRPPGGILARGFPPGEPLPALARVGVYFPLGPGGELNGLRGQILLLAIGADRTDLLIIAHAEWVGTPIGIPAGARLLRITYTPRGPRGSRSVARAVVHRDLTSRRKIEAIRAALDRLPAERPHVHNTDCPPLHGTLALAFYPRDATAEGPVAEASIAEGGCRSALVSVEGTSGPFLEEQEVSSTIIRIAGVRLPGG